MSQIKFLLALNRCLRERKIGFSEFLVMAYLHGGLVISPVVMGQVSKALGMLPAHMTRLVNKLQGQGWVTRTIGSDRRTVYAALTPKGRRWFDELMEEVERCGRESR